MSARVRLLVLASMAGCLSPGSPDGGMTCVEHRQPDIGRVCAPIGPVICAGTECAAGEDCCLTTGRCFDPENSPAECVRPMTSTAAGVVQCSSNHDCAEDEYCMADDRRLCLGPGRCQARSNCGTCGPAGSERCSQCGCNGVTYESIQAACVAGVRAVGSGACGTVSGWGFGPAQIYCGTSAQCPAGRECCAITGRCFDPEQPWRCVRQPDGGVLDCVGNQDCTPAGSGGGSGGSGFCQGDGCGTPGICRTPSGGCDGVLTPVCGCDGKTYTNACWAGAASTRVRSSSSCDGG
ncbi:MAG: Kazal-type serine protease inhibitor family protein [Myxococcaceae bacterium]